MKAGAYAEIVCLLVPQVLRFSSLVSRVCHVRVCVCVRLLGGRQREMDELNGLIFYCCFGLIVDTVRDKMLWWWWTYCRWGAFIDTLYCIFTSNLEAKVKCSCVKVAPENILMVLCLNVHLPRLQQVIQFIVCICRNTFVQYFWSGR